MSPDLAFQQVVNQALLAVLPVPLEVHPPHSTALPYVQIGESEVLDHPAGHEIVMVLHAWSSLEGPHEVKGIMQTIRGALHGRDFVFAPWTFVACREQEAETFLDPDTETWHGVQRFRVIASD